MHSKFISPRFVFVLFCICLGSFFAFFDVAKLISLSVSFNSFRSVFVLFGGGSSFASDARFFELVFRFDAFVCLPDLTLEELA